MALASSFTVFFIGLVALFETDLKKVVAISTLSQLGVIFYGLSFGLWKLTFFHILVHALFKASLFIVVGGMIVLWFGGQDYR